jgi:septal ring factor EnvC (AmiA/AmiB activator)
MRTLRAFAVASAVVCAGCGNPRAEAATAQALNDAANEISGLKNDLGQMQNDLDSLRQVVAKQDSAITQIRAQLQPR